MNITDVERWYRNHYHAEKKRAEDYRTAFLISLIAVVLLIYPWLDEFVTGVFA